MKHIIFDAETTGLLLPSTVALDEQPKIIELGCVVIERNKIISEHSWVINPGEQITEIITKITGITNDDLVGMPTFSQVVREIENVFSEADTLIAHNMRFDKTMLTNELKRINKNDFPWPPNLVCTVQEFVPRFGKFMSLKNLYEKIMGVKLNQTHRALDDVIAVSEILFKENFFETIEAANDPVKNKN